MLCLQACNIAFIFSDEMHDKMSLDGKIEENECNRINSTSEEDGEMLFQKCDGRKIITGSE
jgi:hypothetical protein